MVGAALGIGTILADWSPSEKVNAARLESANGTTIMVGDGIYDACALTTAAIGVAMGARGAAASSEAADARLGLGARLAARSGTTRLKPRRRAR